MVLTGGSVGLADSLFELRLQEPGDFSDLGESVHLKFREYRCAISHHIEYPFSLGEQFYFKFRKINKKFCRQTVRFWFVVSLCAVVYFYFHVYLMTLKKQVRLLQ